MPNSFSSSRAGRSAFRSGYRGKMGARGAWPDRAGPELGEMALLDGGKRSADIVADERVICYGLAVGQLQELAADHPNIMITILGNLTREFKSVCATLTKKSAHSNSRTAEGSRRTRAVMDNSPFGRSSTATAIRHSNGRPSHVAGVDVHSLGNTGEAFTGSPR